MCPKHRAWGPKTMTKPDEFNAFLEHAAGDSAPAGAGALAGLTLAVKDIFDVAGIRSGWGNPQRLAESAPASKTMPAVQALIDQGARFVGKTQTDELAFSLMGHNAHYPQPINPRAPDRVTGGSSSGSAAAVAGGLADIAVGSDTGGSIRAPASFCGLIGLRTTHGAISLDGAMKLAPSFDTFGWFAKDAATYEKVGRVFFAPQSSPMRPRLIRVAELDALLLGPAEADAYRAMVDRLARLFGDARNTAALSQPIDDLYWCFRKIQGFEAWGSHGAWISAGDRQLGPGVKDRFEFGATITAATVAAETVRRDAFREALSALLGSDGLLVMPTVPGAAPLRNEPFDTLQAYREQALRLLCVSVLSGFPQITLPLGTVDGAPFGISLLGPAGSDMQLIGLAKTVLDASPAT